jgi:hypothetical protein
LENILKIRTDKMKDTRLYNLIFPLWLLWIFPAVWIIVLPANFVIDFAVAAVAMKCLRVTDIKSRLKRCMWKIWLLGFVADIIGSLPMLAANFINLDHSTVFGSWWNDELLYGINFNPFYNAFSVVFVIVCIMLSAAFIYAFNSRIALKKSGLGDYERKMVSAALAIFTAPYVFLVPTAMMYGF